MRKFVETHPQSTLIVLCMIYLAIKAAFLFFGQADTINVESDNLLYDAKLVSEGIVPFAELLTRSIVPLYIYAGSFILFGIHIKLTLLFVYCAMAMAGYFLGRITYSLTGSSWVAVIATISYWIIGGRDIADMFLLAGVWLLMLWKQQSKWQFAFPIGLCTGLAVLSYRAYVAWLIVIGLLLLYFMVTQLSRHHIQLTGKSLAAYFGGVVISLILPLVWFVYLTNWTWMSQLYLVDQIVYGVIGSIIVVVGLYFILQFTTKRRWLTWFIYCAILIIAIVFSWYRIDVLTIKVAAFHDFARSTMWAIIPTMAVLWSGMIAVFRPPIKWLKYFVGMIFVALIELFVIGAFHPDRGPSLELSQSGKYYFIAIILVSVLVTYQWITTQKQQKISLWTLALIGLSLSAMFAASLLYGEWLPSYIHNYAIGLAISTGIFFHWVLQAPAGRLRQQVIMVAIISMIFCLFIFPKIILHEVSFNSAVELHTEDAFAVVEYIKTNSALDDTVFTAVPLFALRSGRDLVAPITHPVAYISSRDAPFEYDPYGVVPTVSDLIVTLESKQPKFVIADQRTESLFMTSRHPAMNEYIRNHYTKKIVFGDIKIFQRNK